MFHHLRENIKSRRPQRVDSGSLEYIDTIALILSYLAALQHFSFGRTANSQWLQSTLDLTTRTIDKIQR